MMSIFHRRPMKELALDGEPEVERGPAWRFSATSMRTKGPCGAGAALRGQITRLWAERASR
jgi:hypothetical protein